MKKALRGSLFGLLAGASIGVAQAGVYDDMIVAARNGDSEKIMALIQRGMDVNTADQNGTTLAMYAARSGDEKLLEYLLSNHANMLISNKFGDDAMLLATLEGRTTCVKLLAKAGAEISPEREGWKPLNYAAFAGRLDIAAYLLEQGAKVDARAPNGMTSLMLAARNGFLPVVKLLLDNHASANLKTPDGKTALDIAREANQTQIVELLNAGGAHDE